MIENRPLIIDDRLTLGWSNTGPAARIALTDREPSVGTRHIAGARGSGHEA
jgi:hypothetical protein